MEEIFDIEAWQQVVVNSLTELGADVARFLPKLVGTLVLLLVGWAVSKLVEVLVRRLLHRLGLDRVSARIRVAEALQRAGVEAPPSRIIARLLFWALMLTFILSAVETLGLTAATAAIDRLIGFIPNAVTAGLMILFGLLLGRFIRNLAGSGAAAVGLGGARRIGSAAGGLVVLLVAVLALEQLGIETALLVTVLTVLVGAACLTVGVSFALGARPIVTHILAGHFLRQSLPNGSLVEIQGQKGTIERIGPLDTLVREGGRSWSIPNATLMEETVLR